MRGGGGVTCLRVHERKYPRMFDFADLTFKNTGSGSDHKKPGPTIKKPGQDPIIKTESGY